jgi:hypothetical protein
MVSLPQVRKLAQKDKEEGVEAAWPFGEEPQ